jgi:hypothetical protein
MSDILLFLGCLGLCGGSTVPAYRYLRRKNDRAS